MCSTRRGKYYLCYLYWDMHRLWRPFCSSLRCLCKVDWKNVLLKVDWEFRRKVTLQVCGEKFFFRGLNGKTWTFWWKNDSSDIHETFYKIFGRREYTTSNGEVSSTKIKIKKIEKNILGEYFPFLISKWFDCFSNWLFVLLIGINNVSVSTHLIGNYWYHCFWNCECFVNFSFILIVHNNFSIWMFMNVLFTCWLRIMLFKTYSNGEVS